MGSPPGALLVLGSTETSVQLDAGGHRAIAEGVCPLRTFRRLVPLPLFFLLYFDFPDYREVSVDRNTAIGTQILK